MNVSNNGLYYRQMLMRLKRPGFPIVSQVRQMQGTKALNGQLRMKCHAFLGYQRRYIFTSVLNVKLKWIEKYNNDSSGQFYGIHRFLKTLNKMIVSSMDPHSKL